MSRQLLKKSQETLAKTTVLRLRNSTGPSVNTIQQRQYHENVIDHYENPRNVGSLDKADKDVGTGLVGAPACGDVMKLQIKVDENGRIVDQNSKLLVVDQQLRQALLLPNGSKEEPWTNVSVSRTRTSPVT